MKTKAFSAVLTFALVLILSTAASAQGWRMSADIPFSFNVGDVKMNSGTYIVQLSSANHLTIRSATDHKMIVTLVNEALRRRDLQGGRLVFNTYGDDHFLSKVFWGEGPARELPPASIERLVAKNLSHVRKLEVATK